MTQLLDRFAFASEGKLRPAKMGLHTCSRGPRHPFGWRKPPGRFAAGAFLLPLLLGLWIGGPPSSEAAGRTTENVFLITIDGLRWQEVFSGAEELLLSQEHGGVASSSRLRAAFWRATAEQRRAALMPFVWSVLATQGQLFGNQHKGSVARLTNGRKFTYPGFNEILTGFADPRIDSNEKRPNPNVTVLEWLHRKPGFARRIAAFANWDVFPYILNTARSGIRIWTGYETNRAARPGSRFEVVESLFHDITPLWPNMNFDAFYLHAALESMKERRPRVVWIAFSEPDEWAHEGRYDYYLLAAHKIDSYARKLWTQAQALPAYRGKTTFLLTCDHGRGSGPTAWKDHGETVQGAEDIWIAAIGPDTPPLGERANIAPVTQNQIAATLAALLGHDYAGAVPQAGPPIADLLGARGTPLRRPGRAAGR